MGPADITLDTVSQAGAIRLLSVYIPSNSLARGRLPMNQTTALGRPDASLSKPGGTIGGCGMGGTSRRGAGGGEKSRRLRSSS